KSKEGVRAMGAAKYTYSLIDPDSLTTVASTKWLVEGLLPLKEITFVCGPPKQFKTFLTLAWLLCVATGRDWLGHKVQRRKVLYIIGEGGDAFMGRIKAWQILNNVPDLGQHFMVLRRMVNLYDDSLISAVNEIKAQCSTPEVIVIDTLGRAMGGAK